MSAEKFLLKFFEKLTESDFQSDEFLVAFYKFYKKTKTDSLFSCYIEYLIRNRSFKDTNDRTNELNKLYNEIRDAILNRDEDASTNIGFISEKERTETSERQLVHSSDVVSGETFKQSSVPTTSTTTKTSKQPIKFNKAKALRILSTFIKQSFIITYDDPEQETTEEDQEYREIATDVILDEIKTLDGRSLPTAKKDIMFGQRVDMMNVWHDTENKCHELSEDEQLNMLISKVFYLDSSSIANTTQKITSVKLKEINEILPVEEFVSCRSGKSYSTVIRLVNSHPIDETVSRSRQKIKCLYICAGSQMVIGGNADQGIDVNESLLYLTSTYSTGIEKALHAYPMAIGQLLLCPNVLVFKDSNYKMLPIQKWQRIAVMNAPSKWRPKLRDGSIKKPEDISGKEDSYSHDISPFDSKATFADKNDIVLMKNIINGMAETALFFGYDTLILDDRAIEDNNLPAYVTAKLLKEELNKYNGRFREIIICCNKSNSFNVFRCFFPVV
jgi:hypothetical protein